MSVHSSAESPDTRARTNPVQKMAAVQFRRYGGPEVLEVLAVPRPTPGPDDVLVAVEASDPASGIARDGGHLADGAAGIGEGTPEFWEGCPFGYQYRYHIAA
jgi:hypothetical protein